MTLTAADLRRVDLFDDASDAEVDEWVAAAQELRYAAGELIVEHGVPSPGIHLLLEGRIRAETVEDGRAEPLGFQEAPTWMGAIATLLEGEIMVRMTAEEDCGLALIGAEDVRRLALAHPSVHRRIMAQVAPVMRGMTVWEQNRERLAALGTMAAGLAHELNNPAAAARRAAGDLVETLDTISRTLTTFVESGIERDQAAQLIELQREAIAGAAGRTKLDALDAADAEDDLLELLEDAGVAEAWKLAPALAAAGIEADWVARVQALAGSATDAMLSWVAASLTASELAGELIESTDRMSGLVKAVKQYSYMDQGDVVDVDLHQGLETTLAILGHKLKHTAIEVVREYDRELPTLLARGPELNQVWTNLLDNAIDALGEGPGTITVRTRRDGDCVEIDVADDGQGIPDDVRDRVFEPFFTTKGVGAGTGLGLDAARRIIVDRHRGSLTFSSAPGETVFRARLPLGAPA